MIVFTLEICIFKNGCAKLKGNVNATLRVSRPLHSGANGLNPKLVDRNMNAAVKNGPKRQIFLSVKVYNY